MRPLIEPTSLEDLNRQVQEIETRRGAEPSAHVASGWGELDQTLGGGLARGMVQEWFGEHAPPLAIIGHLAGRALLDQPAGWAVWIGAEIWPYPHALVQPFTTENTEGTEQAKGEERNSNDESMFEIRMTKRRTAVSNFPHSSLVRPSNLALRHSLPSSVLSVVNRSLWLNPATEDDRLWAIDQALRCSAVAVLIADASGLNMAATRRLQLAAKTGNALAMLVRPDHERAELSAAALRWRVSSARSPNRHPRWTVELLRHKGHALNGPQRTWLVERNRAQGFVDLSAQLRHRTGETEDAGSRRSA